MFTTKCFIRKNTPELRKRLEELGYKYSTFDDLKLDGIVIFPAKNEYSVWANYHFDKKYTLKSYVDCGTNEELFLALAALRDDKPDYQWFVWDDDGVAYNKFKQYIPGEPWEEWWWFEVHKATVEELIEHFQENELINKYCKDLLTKCKPLENEFSKFVDDNFDDLI